MQKQMKATIFEVDIDKVFENPANPRTIKAAAFKKLVKSIEDFPQMLWKRPPVCESQDDGTYMALGGNKRSEAARKAGLKRIPIMLADDWTAEQKKRFIVLDNDASGEWDFKMLVGQYDMTFLLQSTSIALPSSMLRGSAIAEVPPPPKPKATSIRGGDVIEIGPHRLVCGDSGSAEVIDLLFGSEKTCTMVHTDPPYNVDYGSSKKPRHVIRSVANDNLSGPNWEAFCKKMFATFKERSTGDVYVWGASSPEGMKMRLWLVEAGCHWSATIVWNKDQLVLSPANYQRRYEPCFYGWFGKSSFRAGRDETEVWDVPRPKVSKEHPTMKPIALCAIAIRNSSEEGDIVLDPFMGSGSTMIAAHQLGRRCFGVELDPIYCQVVLDRMKALAPDLKVVVRKAAAVSA